AVRLYREAFAADPQVAEELTEDVRLTAACAAVHASGDKATDEKERARLVSDALTWLSADLVAWSAVLCEKNEAGRILLMQKLNRWKNRGDLVWIRDAEQVRELSTEQQAKCRTLWRKVDRLLQEAIAAGQ